METASWEEVFRTQDQVEMELVRGLLITNGFLVVVEAKGLKSMPAIFGHASNGELILRVPPDMAEQAVALLQAKAEMEDEESEQP